MTKRRKKGDRPLSDVERWRNLCDALADDALTEDAKPDFLAGLAIGVAPALLREGNERRKTVAPDEKHPQGENVQGTPGLPDDRSPDARKQ